MKSKIILTLLLITGTLIAQELPTQPKQEYTPSLEESSKTVQQKFGYFSAGLGPFPIPLPAFSAGFRAQSGHNGIDTSLQAQTIVFATGLKGNVLYLYYPKPNKLSQFYMGGGIGPGYVFIHGSRFHDNPGFLLSSEFVFGKQYRNETDDLRFFQLQVSFPTFEFYKHSMSWKFHTSGPVFFPFTIISYGIGF